MVSIYAEPYPFEFDLDRAALLIIDMQRDFLEPGGFGESLGNDVSLLRRTIDPLKTLLAAARHSGLKVIHTREGHRPDLSDLPRAKKVRGNPRQAIGDMSPMGRILVRGEAGHDIIPELYPIAGEPVIDKPGKGVLRHRPGYDPEECRDRPADRLRRHHRGLRQHHRPRGQRPRL